MGLLDWVVLFLTLVSIISYGIWKSGRNKSLKSYLVSDKKMHWLTVGMSVMATQASAITFLSTPGQGFDNGMYFLQFYFGLPLALLILSYTLLPVYHKLNVTTAYEYLENRFDLKTRSLGVFLFLTQRGLAAGLTIYAPSLILSNILGWNLPYTIFAIGLIVIVFTVLGGAKAVGYAQKHQMFVIFAGIGLAGLMIISLLPKEVSLSDAIQVAEKMGKLEAVDWKFDLNSRYNVWSGTIGGVFLFLSYFGTDQCQVQRYIAGKNVKQARLGLLFNGVLKIPLQFFILMIGVLLFVFYQFVKPPIFFDSHESEKLYSGLYSPDFKQLESKYDAVFELKKRKVQDLLTAVKDENEAKVTILQSELQVLEKQNKEVREEAKSLILKNNPEANINDLDQVFLGFVIKYLPSGLVGLLVAVILSASMSSSSSEISALATTTLVDIYSRLFNKEASIFVSKIFTVAWGLYAILFAQFAGMLGNLIQVVNILGSLFYGTILGIFLTGFYFRKITGTEVFIAALLGEILVFCCFFFTSISFLWYNVVGCLSVFIISFVIHYSFKKKKPDSLDFVKEKVFLPQFSEQQLVEW